MDGNKDEALKCLKIAQSSIESGNRDRALKFLNKARRLDPSVEIEHLLSKIDSVHEPTCDNPSNPSKPSDNGPRRRASPAGSSSSGSYTEEQVAIVSEIRKKKDYYNVLGLEKSCSVEDVRKAYRKLSLKVHPDKNNAPGAEDAFKLVSKAFQCLSDEESRKRYDLVGSDEPVYEHRPARRGRGSNQFNGFYEDVDAEEIFRNFFFGGMHPASTTSFGTFSFGPGLGVRMGGGGGGGHNGNNGLIRMLIQFLPVLLILLANLLPSSEPTYSLSRSYPYEHLFSTSRGVNYYVKSDVKFEQDYPPDSPKRLQLEQKVERDYFSILSHNCRLEVQQLHWGYRKDTPNCEALKQFEGMAY